jgi:hypothetical protein
MPEAEGDVMNAEIRTAERLDKARRGRRTSVGENVPCVFGDYCRGHGGDGVYGEDVSVAQACTRLCAGVGGGETRYQQKSGRLPGRQWKSRGCGGFARGPWGSAVSSGGRMSR